MRWFLGLTVLLIIQSSYAGDTIRVLTWNVLADATSMEKRIPELLKIMEAQDADVIAFQETAGWFVRELRKTAWAKKYPFKAGPMRGLYIISKLKTRFVRGGPLPGRQGRGWLMCEVKKGDTSIRIGTCHLESPLAAGPTRERQIPVFEKQFAGARHAVFLGDFNFGDGENENRKLKNWVDVWPKLRPGKPGMTWDMEKNPWRSKARFPERRAEGLIVSSLEVWPPRRSRSLGARRCPVQRGSFHLTISA